LAEAVAYLEQDGLSRVFARARQRVVALGRVGGSFELVALTPGEAGALGGLLGSLRRMRRPRAGESFRVSLRDLDLALRQTRFRLGLVEALELIGPPVESAPARRAATRARLDAGWRKALDHQLCRNDRAVGTWVEWLRNRGRLARTGGTEPFALLATALNVGARLPADPPVERTRLASLELQGDPHALDDDRPLARLLTSQLAHRAGEAMPKSRIEQRLLWQRFGVLADAASADVLTLNLRPVADGPLARALHTMAGQHFRITLGQFSRTRLRFGRDDAVVFACENPTVLLAAEARIGIACPPLICVGGWPSAAACALLERLAAAGATVCYHGDFDAKGIEIYGLLRRRFGVVPWRYDSSSYRQVVAHHEDRTRALRGELRDTSRDAARLVQAVRERGRELHEEVVLDELLADLEAAGRPPRGRGSGVFDFEPGGGDLDRVQGLPTGTGDLDEERVVIDADDGAGSAGGPSADCLAQHDDVVF
jgi:uncharacterized protein (TIGR02679 family)